jgi:hypothetical protein
MTLSIEIPSLGALFRIPRPEGNTAGVANSRAVLHFAQAQRRVHLETAWPDTRSLATSD